MSALQPVLPAGTATSPPVSRWAERAASAGISAEPCTQTSLPLGSSPCGTAPSCIALADPPGKSHCPAGSTGTGRHGEVVCAAIGLAAVLGLSACAPAKSPVGAAVTSTAGPTAGAASPHSTRAPSNGASAPGASPGASPAAASVTITAVGDTMLFAFRDPPGYVRYLKQAGFTILNDANNHSYDFGAAGQAQTVRV
ncbi:MAG: CapA family protein, partial [Streptosporangiaceae bacterium]